MIGLHIIGDPPELYQLVAQQPPAAILYLNPKDSIPHFAPITIGRIHYEPGTQDALLSSPVGGGRKVARDCIERAERCGITIWQGLNEIAVHNRAEADRYNAFERARVEALEAAGLVAGLYSWSVGWPMEDLSRSNLYPEWYAPLMDWVGHEHYVIFHQYWGPDGPLAPDSYDPLRPSKVDRQRYWPWPHRILITECGIDLTGDPDNGWKARVPQGLNLEQWADVYDTQLQDFDTLVSQDGRVVGKTIFMFGQGEWSHTFGIETHWRQFDCLVTDPSGPPPDPPPTGPTIRVKMTDGSVDRMLIEEYLRGVVPAEMPALWPLEALKAQAVAARTYAVHAIEDPLHANADICTTTCCQVYNPDMIHPNSDRAIEETAGVVMLYDGEVIQAFYSANCGGLTRSNREVWGGDHLPYLEPVDCVNPGPKNGHGVGMCQWGARDMAEYYRSDYAEILKHYYSHVVLSNEGGDTVPAPPVEPIPEGGSEMGFDHDGWIEQFLANPGMNDATDKDVEIHRTPGAEARVIGVHVLTGTENAFDHHILLAVVDKDGKRIHNAQVDWAWVGMAESETPNPVVLDKPPSDGPPGNLPIMPGMDITVRVRGMKSDSVSGLHTGHIREDMIGNNRLGHWSYLIVWQVGEAGPIPPDPVPVPVDPVPAPGNLNEIIAAARTVRDDIDEVIAMLVRL